MANTYKYTILTAVPDARRGERVNVGIVVFRDDFLDVRFRQASSKLKALTGATWESRIYSVQERIEQLFERGAQAETILEKIQNIDPIISSVGLGSINVAGDDYESVTEEIISSLVLPPKQKRAESQSRINTEIARVFREAKVLAKPHASLTERKIVRDLPVAPSEGLTADFALQNGVMHIASTLDLRKQNASIAEAALKSIVLDKSGEVWGTKGVRKIGVYAVLPDMKQQFKQHVELLNDYADETYNGADSKDHRKFIRTMYDALPPVFFNRK